MEIHVPGKHPIMTVREAVVHLGIVTIGILIALSFEGARQAVEQRQLAVEARANLRDEVTRNKTALDETLQKVASQQREYRRMHAAILNLMANKPFGDDDVHLQPPLANLSSAAYATAQVTGAFGFMEYEEVRRFTSLYDFQSSYKTTQERFFNLQTSLAGPMLVGGLTKSTAAELAITKGQIQEGLATLIMLQNMGTALSNAYGEELAPDRKRHGTDD